MELDDIKKQWENMNIRISPSDLRQRTTSLDSLMHAYRRFALLSVGCILCSGSFFRLIQLGAMAVSPAVVILFIAAMAFAAAVDCYLYHSLKKIDLLSMTVSEVSARATACRRVHLLSQLILLPLALTVIVLFALGANSFMRYGIIAGASLGFIIGLNAWLKIMRTYRTLIP